MPTGWEFLRGARTHTHKMGFYMHCTPSMGKSTQPAMGVSGDDGKWVLNSEAKGLALGSCEPCCSDDLAASLDPEPAPLVRVSGKQLCHEDKATHANCCLLADPQPIYSVGPGKQMFSAIHLQVLLARRLAPFWS